tara:strand:- start:60 stop:917 length:858 start_codon:yes stop_codon:yes gene_type:complete
MSRISGATPMSNYSTFKEQFKRSGYSASNFYDVIIELEGNPKLVRQLSRDDEFDLQPSKNLLRIYTDEASIPGLQISTGDYRITNTPNLKYAYGAVFSEMELSFMMDSDSRIKSIFDLWTNWIYGYSNQITDFPNSIEDILRSSAPQKNFRAAYRDDYTCDIIIIKYEKYMNGKKNSEEPNNNSLAYSLRDIIPDIRDKKSLMNSGFYKAIPVHAVKLFNAFPSNIASIPLNREETSISKLSVSFEYETYTTTTFNGDSVSNFRDPINGGGEGIDILDALLGLIR